MNKIKTNLSVLALTRAIMYAIVYVVFPHGFLSGKSKTNFGIVAVFAQEIDRKINVVNESGHRVEIYWVHPNTGELMRQSDPHIFNGATFSLNSYLGHKFQATELPGIKSGVCGSVRNTCRKNWFTVNENHDQAVTIDRDFEVIHMDNKARAREKAAEMLKKCQQTQIEYIQINASNLSPDLLSKAVDNLKACVESNMENKVEEVEEEIDFQKRIRTKMGVALETYTCADETPDYSEPEKSVSWSNKRRSYSVDKMLDREHSKIHVIKHFIGDRECQVINDAVKPNMKETSIADFNNEGHIRTSQRIMMAHLNVPWERERRGDLIAKVSRRGFEYANDSLGLNIDKFPQEALNVFHYIGQGIEDMEPIHYGPHCDGECIGQRHETGGTIATMIAYCEVAEKGGTSIFRNASIKFKPEKGDAVFISYIGKDAKMDDGFTVRSVCPVIDGEQKVIKQIMRLGDEK